MGYHTDGYTIPKQPNSVARMVSQYRGGMVYPYYKRTSPQVQWGQEGDHGSRFSISPPHLYIWAILSCCHVGITVYNNNKPSPSHHRYLVCSPFPGMGGWWHCYTHITWYCWTFFRDSTEWSRQATRRCKPQLASLFGGAVLHRTTLGHVIALPQQLTGLGKSHGVKLLQCYESGVASGVKKIGILKFTWLDIAKWTQMDNCRNPTYGLSLAETPRFRSKAAISHVFSNPRIFSQSFMLPWITLACSGTMLWSLGSSLPRIIAEWCFFKGQEWCWMIWL